MQSEELRLWNFQVLANLLRKRVVNFFMARMVEVLPAARLTYTL